MAYTYILLDTRDKVYVGSTTDIVRRLGEHRRGHTATTNRMYDIQIAWQKESPSLEEARRIEKKIKQWKSRKMINLIIQGKLQV